MGIIDTLFLLLLLPTDPDSQGGMDVCFQVENDALLLPMIGTVIMDTLLAAHKCLAEALLGVVSELARIAAHPKIADNNYEGTVALITAMRSKSKEIPENRDGGDSEDDDDEDNDEDEGDDQDDDGGDGEYSGDEGNQNKEEEEDDDDDDDDVVPGENGEGGSDDDDDDNDDDLDDDDDEEDEDEEEEEEEELPQPPSKKRK